MDYSIASVWEVAVEVPMPREDVYRTLALVVILPLTRQAPTPDKQVVYKSGLNGK